MNTTQLFYGTILLTAILGLVLAGVALSFRDVIKKYWKLKEEHERLVSEARAKQAASELMAKKMADSIILEAQGRARTLIEEAVGFSQKSQAQFSEEVKKTTEIQLANFQNAIAAVQKEAQGTLGSLSSDVRSELGRQMEALREALTSQITNSQITAQKAVEAAYDKVEVEVQSYKKLRLSQVDERIFEILEGITQKVIAKSLKSEEQEELVIDALEEARRQNVL